MSIFAKVDHLRGADRYEKGNAIMGVTRKIYPKPLPVGAEIFTTDDGEKRARWRDAYGRKREAKLTADGCGVLLESGIWTATYRDGRGRLKTRSTGCKTRDGALRKLAEWEAEAERVRAGVLSVADVEAAEHSQDLVCDAIAAYEAHLRTAGRAACHYTEKRHLLDLATKACGWRRLCDLDTKRARAWLETIRETGLSAQSRKAGKGLAARTVNKYGIYLKSFGTWLQTTGRTVGNPFDGLPKWSEADDRRHTRRAFTPEELAIFLAAAEARPERDRLTFNRGIHKGQLGAKPDPKSIAAARRLGRERALCWRMLAYTGLRIGELRALRLCDVILQGDKPRVELPAKHAKNRRGATLPLRADLAALLGAWMADRLQIEREAARDKGNPIPARMDPSAKLFPNAPSSVRVFHLDRAAAGLDREDDRGRVLDVHSLRQTFGSMLSAAGVPLVTAQHLMRHSDPKLTATIYTDARLLDLPGAVAKLPDLHPLQEPVARAAQAGENGVQKHARNHAVAGGNQGHFCTVPVQSQLEKRDDRLQEHDSEKSNVDRGFRVQSTADNEKKMAETAGLEPVTSGVTGRCYGVDNSNDESILQQSKKTACTDSCTANPFADLLTALANLTPEQRAALADLLRLG